MNPRAYLSLLISFALTVAPAFGAAAGAHWSQVAIIGLGISLAGTFNVWVAPNVPDAQYVKPAVAWVLAALLALQQVVGSGGVQALTVAQWIMVGAAAFAAIGITAFPNTPVSTLRSADPTSRNAPSR